MWALVSFLYICILWRNEWKSQKLTLTTPTSGSFRTCRAVAYFFAARPSTPVLPSPSALFLRLTGKRTAAAIKQEIVGMRNSSSGEEDWKKLGTALPCHPSTAVAAFLCWTPPPYYICLPPPAVVSGDQKTKYNSLALSSISKNVGTRRRSPSYERFLEGWSSPFMRFAEHLTALRAWCKRRLPDWWKLDVLRPGMVGMRGPMVIRLWPCTNWVPPPPVPWKPSVKERIEERVWLALRNEVKKDKHFEIRMGGWGKILEWRHICTPRWTRRKSLNFDLV